MIKARFIGESDDFFKYLRTYTIIDSWIAPSFSIGTAPRGCLWVKFARESYTCPVCGQEVRKEPIGQEPTERYRDYLEAIATVRQDEGVLTPERLKRMEEGSDCAFYVGFDHTGTLAVSALDLYENDVLSGAILFDTKGHAQASLDKHSDEWKTIANYDWSRE